MRVRLFRCGCYRQVRFFGCSCWVQVRLLGAVVRRGCACLGCGWYASLVRLLGAGTLVWMRLLVRYPHRPLQCTLMYRIHTTCTVACPAYAPCKKKKGAPCQTHRTKKKAYQTHVPNVPYQHKWYQTHVPKTCTKLAAYRPQLAAYRKLLIGVGKLLIWYMWLVHVFGTIFLVHMVQYIGTYGTGGTCVRYAFFFGTLRLVHTVQYM